MYGGYVELDFVLQNHRWWQEGYLFLWGGIQSPLYRPLQPLVPRIFFPVAGPGTPVFLCKSPSTSDCFDSFCWDSEEETSLFLSPEHPPSIIPLPVNKLAIFITARIS